MSGTIGKKTWLIPDGFLSSKSTGLFPSHEAICVLNASQEDATVRLTLFFEDREELGGFSAVCGARKTKHIRLDRIASDAGRPIPRDVPYALLVESSAPIVVQYSRMDTSQAEMALMTTIAYPAE